MKKNFLFLTLLFVVISAAFSKAPYQMEMTRQFTLQAGYDHAAEISIAPVVAQGQSYIAGMPFNIEDKQVQYGVTEQGREIARWDVLSNTNFNIKISGTKLQPVDEIGNVKTGFEDDGLDYYLRFSYTIGYVDSSGEQKTSTGEKVYYTAEASSGEFVGLIPTHTADGTLNQFIGGVDGSIFFVFDKASSERIQSDAADDSANGNYLPPGDYMATVTVVLEQA